MTTRPPTRLIGKRAAVENTKRLFAIPHLSAAQHAYRLDTSEYQALQSRLLAGALGDAFAHVPYYRDNGYRLAAETAGASVQEALQGYPVIAKSTVKSDPRAFHRTPAPFGTMEHTTGGTTGTPMRVVAGLNDRGRTEAILAARYERDAGVRRPRILRLTGLLTDESGGDFLKIPLARTAYQSIYSLRRERGAEIAAAIREYRPHVVHGYASALSQLGRSLEGVGPLSALAPDLRATFSTSETLDEGSRGFIESAFGVPVFNEYGSQEGQHLVLECRHRGMHVHPQRGIVELLNLHSDEPAAPGTMGRVVVTGLMARAMPLIRYELGDTAKAIAPDTRCPCGLAWPLIGEVYGRQEDLVRTPDGRRVGLLAHSTLKDVAGIRQAQIQQLSLQDFKYLIVAEDKQLPPQVLDQIRQSLSDRLGYVVNVQFDFVTDIPLTPSGKFRAVVVNF